MERRNSQNARSSIGPSAQPISAKPERQYPPQIVGGATVAVLVLSCLVYFLTKPAKIKPDPNYNPENTPISQAAIEVDPLSRDASAWNVREPDLNSLGSVFKKRWEAGLGEEIVSEERRTVMTRAASGPPGPYAIPAEYQTVPEVRINCGGLIENFVPIGRKFYKQGDHVVATVTYEGDLYGKKAISRKTCGEPVYKGRLSTDVHYIWKSGSYGQNQWVAQDEALADPKFKNSVIKPDTLANGIEENKKFEESLRQEQKEREERHARYKAMRANRNPAP